MNTAQATFLLFDLAIIVLMARGFGVAATRIGQPAVVGEILAGMLLGPTLFDGAIAKALFPADIRPMLGALPTPRPSWPPRLRAALSLPRQMSRQAC